MKLLIYFIVLVIATSCKNYKERNEELIESYPSILQPHFRSFCEKGYEKGYKVKLKNLKVYLTVREEKNATWDAAYYSYEHAIYFDTTCWNFRSNLEMLCWHELGHGILKREHNDKTIKLDGKIYPSSFMNSNCSNNKNEELRQIRINEMFN